MKCPQCNKHMLEGFIPAGQGIYFRRSAGEGMLFPFQQALPGTSTLLRSAFLEAYRCSKCELVVFRYGKAVDDPDDFTHK